MEKLLELASAAADQAEVYALETTSNAVEFENGALHDIAGELASGLSLRIIKDGLLGFAYTRNMNDRAELLGNALASLKGGVEARYDFPSPREFAKVAAHDAAVASADSPRLVEECGRIADGLRSRAAGEIVVGARAGETAVRVANSRGLDARVTQSFFRLGGGAIFPGSGSGIFRAMDAKAFKPMPDELLDEIGALFKAGERAVMPSGGRMKVLFMPDAMITLAWRLWHGASARSVYEKVSPVAGRVGEKVLSALVSLVDDPLDDSGPGARPFDDEGTPCGRLAVFDKGVLKEFYNDLHYAQKLGAAPNGRGWRTAVWGGDPLELKPGPALAHLRIEAGASSFRDLVAMMDRGIILCCVLGSHSGNIPNGDYSVGVAPGLYVERGEIVGRVKDAMVSGNAYETLGNAIGVGSRLDPAFGGSFPPVLCEGVSVSSKS